jgi:hypothetical protein
MKLIDPLIDKALYFFSQIIILDLLGIMLSLLLFIFLPKVLDKYLEFFRSLFIQLILEVISLNQLFVRGLLHTGKNILGSL